MGIDLAGMIQRSTASGWMLVIIGISGLFGIWRLYVIARPKMKQLEMDGEEKMRAEMWQDIASLKAAKNDIGLRLAKAEKQIAAQTVELGQMRFIINLVVSELEVESPGNPIARQARVLMDAMQSAGPAREARDGDLIDKLREVQ